MARLEGKVALVAGGANDLIEAVVRAMAAEGAAIALSGVDREAGEDLARDLAAHGVHITYIEQNVADEASWDKTFAEVVSRLGPIAVLVNSTQIVSETSIEDIDLSGWRQAMSDNLDAVFLGTRMGVRTMKNAGGSIINVATVEGLGADPRRSAYSASIGAVRALTESAALHCEEQGYGIRVNSVYAGVAPAFFAADENVQTSDDSAAKGEHRLAGRIPIKLFGEKSEFAAGVVFLASDESSDVTGAELVVDDGYTAH